MEKDETFDNFYAKFSNLVNFLYKLGHPIDDEKFIEKVLVRIPPQFKNKVIYFETFYKPYELKIK